MSRDIDNDAREIAKERRPPEQLSFPNEPVSNRDNRSRQRGQSGRRVFSVSPDERQTMVEIGRFRVLAADDLVAFRYRGSQGNMRQDLRSLAVQGLVQQKSVWTGRNRETLVFWALTKAGKNWLKRQHVVTPGQAIYSGFVKPRELRHDASIYRMYQREQERIERDGGRVRRVVLDYELKKKVYSPLAKAKALPHAEYAVCHAEIAHENNLKIVNGHITLPDLRIEYQTMQGVAAHVDLEVASKSYHGSHAAEKAAAGFTIYADADTAARLSKALDEREITAEILYL